MAFHWAFMALFAMQWIYFVLVNNLTNFGALENISLPNIHKYKNTLRHLFSSIQNSMFSLNLEVCSF